MTCQCIACARFDLRSAGRMAEQGFGNCKADRGELAKATYKSANWPRECSKFIQEDDATVEKRVQWFKTKGNGNG